MRFARRSPQLQVQKRPPPPSLYARYVARSPDRSAKSKAAPTAHATADPPCTYVYVVSSYDADKPYTTVE